MKKSKKRGKKGIKRRKLKAAKKVSTATTVIQVEKNKTETKPESKSKLRATKTETKTEITISPTIRSKHQNKLDTIADKAVIISTTGKREELRFNLFSECSQQDKASFLNGLNFVILQASVQAKDIIENDKKLKNLYPYFVGIYETAKSATCLFELID